MHDPQCNQFRLSLRKLSIVLGEVSLGMTGSTSLSFFLSRLLILTPFTHKNEPNEQTYVQKSASLIIGFAFTTTLLLGSIFDRLIHTHEDKLRRQAAVQQRGLISVPEDDYLLGSSAIRCWIQQRVGTIHTGFMGDYSG